MTARTSWAIEPEVAGQLGPRTEMDRSTHPPVVKSLHFVLSGWLGDALLETFPCYLATQEAIEKLAEAGLSGWADADVAFEIDEQLLGREPNLHVPTFRWFQITGELGLDDFAIGADLRLVVSARALDVLRRLGIANAELEPVTVP